MRNPAVAPPFCLSLRYKVVYCVVVDVFFTRTDRASTIPINIRGCQSGSSTWSAGQEKIRGLSDLQCRVS